VIEGKDLIVVPMSYYDEFRRDPLDSMLKYGSLPQRARAPWFTDPGVIDRALMLPDQVVGPRSEQIDPKIASRSLVAASDEYSLIGGIAEYFRSVDNGYWHVHVDLALNKKRHGDAAGIAMGRIVSYAEETSTDPLMNSYTRIVRGYEVPLVAQIVAPAGGQIYIGAIVRFILQLKQLRGFNITSFSFDGFQSADAMQQLALAGLVTAGMVIDPNTGEIVGLPRAFSVDNTSVQPYRELLEGANEDRIAIARYALLRKELRELEVTMPGRAPDHQPNGSKDTGDPVAGVVGYLAAYGHAELQAEHDVVVDRGDLDDAYDLVPAQSFAIEESSDGGFGVDGDDPFSDFGVE
jgi:hypothetical protein